MSTSDRSEIEATELDGVVVAADAVAALESGTRIGSYIIRKLIGAGGMGRVYLAEQTHPVRRNVALKLIHEQYESPFALVWFEVERQALAKMQHPAIAQIFDAGTTAEGIAYLAMEFVEGAPVTDFCREKKLTTEQRLRLFVRICQGVQHAHQKGVIHRDLKPANVLISEIDGIPAPKIIDFGIAVGGVSTANGPMADTAASGRAGTAIYMSPEQAEPTTRDIDTRSDIYSLGVMLFEILTEHHAANIDSHAHQSRASAGRARRGSDDSSSASTEALSPTAELLLDAAQDLPLELQALLRQALAIDRNERYASATALVQDVENYLDRRPLRAMPSSATYIASRFISRHKLAIFSATIVVCALLIGIALSLDGLHRANVAAEQAGIEAQKAEKVANFVQSMLAGIDPDSARGLDRSLMRLMLDSAATRVESELSDEHEVRSAIENTIARSYASIGEYALSAQHYASALEAAQQAAAPLPEQAQLMLSQADSLAYIGRFDDALKLANASLSLLEKYPPDDSQRLRVEARVARQERYAGKFNEAITRYERVLAAQMASLSADDDLVLDTKQGLAIAYSRADRAADAKPLLEHVLTKYRERYGEKNSKTLDVTTTLSINYMEEEKYAEAEALLRPALENVESLLGPNHPNTMVIVSNLGSAIRNLGRVAESKPYYERMLATNLKQNGPTHYLSVSAESNFARLLLDSGDLDGAELHARNAVEHVDAAFGTTNPTRAIFIHTLGAVLIAKHKFEEAEATLNNAYDIFANDPNFGPKHSRTIDVIKDYVSLYTNWNKPAALEQWQNRLETAKSL